MEKTDVKTNSIYVNLMEAIQKIDANEGGIGLHDGEILTPPVLGFSKDGEFIATLYAIAPNAKGVHEITATYTVKCVQKQDVEVVRGFKIGTVNSKLELFRGIPKIKEEFGDTFNITENKQKGFVIGILMIALGLGEQTETSATSILDLVSSMKDELWETVRQLESVSEELKQTKYVKLHESVLNSKEEFEKACMTSDELPYRYIRAQARLNQQATTIQDVVLYASMFKTIVPTELQYYIGHTHEDFFNAVAYLLTFPKDLLTVYREGDEPDAGDETDNDTEDTNK